MDEFQKTFLRAAVSEYDKLSELEKQTGVETRVLARFLSPALGIDESSVESPGYQGSEPFMKVLNTVRGLGEAGLLKELGNGPVYWVTPTEPGRELVRTWDYEERSPAFQGKRLLAYLYEHQQDEDEIARREGVVDGIDVGDLCETLGTSRARYARAVNWAIRQGYAGVRATAGTSIENGDIYITIEGMSAVEEGFQKETAGVTQMVNVYNSTVYGNVMASGRDALAISHPALAPVGDDIRSLLASVQAVIEHLPEESDDRHEALQELHTLTRELTKPSPIRERAQGAIASLGAIASIATLLMPHLDRLRELLQSLPPS